MRYPNLRYGNPVEFAYYIQGMPLADVARRLKRSERCIKNYLTGAEKMPWWIPEILRLQHFEHVEKMRQMNVTPRLKEVKTAPVYRFPRKPAPLLVRIDISALAANS